MVSGNDSTIRTVAELKTGIKKARNAQKIWSSLPVEDRIRKVRKIRQYLIENREEITKSIHNDNGKVLVDALAAEVLPATLAITYYCKNAGRFLKNEKIRAGSLALSNKRSQIVRIPYGVVGIISPWNYPFAIPFSEIIMALLAGNAVILKTASNMPKVSEFLVNSILSTELPEGLFQYLNLPGQTAGDALLENGIDKIFFTGSVQAGKYIMGKAAETLTPVVLELGGNDPMIVCEDANIDRAVNGAIWAGFSSAGQSCGGVERLYIAEKIYDEFIEKLKKQVEAICVDSDNEYNIELGAITTEKQYNHIKSHVDEALGKGAVIIAQSKISHKDTRFFYPATVLENVNHGMAIMKDETFGPVVAVMSFKNIDEAIELSNDSYLGLTASVWSKNRRKAIHIGNRIQAGVVTINDHLMSHGLAETPWGGFKQSGIGRTHGKMGFDEMTHAQVVVDDRLSFVQKNLWWLPYSQKLYNGLAGLIQLQYGSGLRMRLSGLRSLLKVIGRIF